MTKPYASGLDRNEANYTPLTPVSFLAKAAYVYPDRVAVIHGSLRRPWKDVYARCRRLASALARRGVERGDTVAAMLPNIPAMVEMHFGPAMIGAVVNTLNTRLDAETIAFMLDHGEAKVLFTDREFSATVEKALALCKSKPVVIDVDDALHEGGTFLGEKEYEAFLAEGDPGVRVDLPAGRVGRHRAQLHLRDDGQPEGGRVPLSRGVPERDQQYPRLVHAEARRLPVDAADVPLQRVVLQLDDGGGGRHQRVPAQGGPEADPGPHPRAQGDALLRRAHRALDAAQRAGRVEAGHRPRGALPRRRRTAARGGDRGHGPHGLRHHARLRPHRDLRARGGLREASRVGRRCRSRSRCAATAGRAWPTCWRRA